MKIELGSVSTGTHRTADLIPCFVDVARGHCKETWLDEISRRMEGEGYFDSEAAEFDLGDLMMALGENAPHYSYFGAHEGDGADFGFWPHWDAIDEDCHDGSLIKADDPPDLADRPRTLDAPDSWLWVNDHGNTTLYTWDAERRQWSEQWAIV